MRWRRFMVTGILLAAVVIFAVVFGSSSHAGCTRDHSPPDHAKPLSRFDSPIDEARLEISSSPKC